MVAISLLKYFQRININRMNCIHESCKLKSKKEYGGYCWKHRHQYLLQDNLIVLDRFTGNSKDYSLPQLKYFHKHVLRKTSKEKVSKYNKSELFKVIDDYHKQIKYCELNNCGFHPGPGP